MALHWFGEYVSSFFPHEGFLVFRIRQCHRESFSRSQIVVVIVPHVYVVHACCWCEAERNQNKPNGLICLGSEVEINCFLVCFIG